MGSNSGAGLSRLKEVTLSSMVIERVAVFDQAQRAWDRDHLANFMSRKKGIADFETSKPVFLINVMDRHNDWCVVGMAASEIAICCGSCSRPSDFGMWSAAYCCHRMVVRR